MKMSCSLQERLGHFVQSRAPQVPVTISGFVVQMHLVDPTLTAETPSPAVVTAMALDLEVTSESRMLASFSTKSTPYCRRGSPLIRWGSPQAMMSVTLRRSLRRRVVSFSSLRMGRSIPRVLPRWSHHPLRQPHSQL